MEGHGRGLLEERSELHVDVHIEGEDAHPKAENSRYRDYLMEVSIGFSYLIFLHLYCHVNL